MLKKILITGANSYIGTSFEKWIGKWPNEYKVDTVDMKDENWKKKSFKMYDVVFHVAGIAHIKETKKNSDIYYKVNRDLAYEVAKKSKEEGVKQLILVSSMSVYGIETGVISKNTIPKPNSNYGKSKFEAEKLIEQLQDDTFKIAVLRPPMIYGNGCKGNYNRLQKFALKSPIFPDIKNKRSMIYIDNLCEFVKQVIDREKKGLFMPQNYEYVCTSDMVREIAKVHGKKIHMSIIFNILINSLKFNIIKKVFGNLVYDKELSKYDFNYSIYEMKKTIELTEI